MVNYELQLTDHHERPRGRDQITNSISPAISRAVCAGTSADFPRFAEDEGNRDPVEFQVARRERLGRPKGQR